MNYPLLLLLHLFAALFFIGTVFFEVLMLEGIRKRLPRETMRAVEIEIGNRARRIMPWVLLVLYSAGIALAWNYREALAHPFARPMGLFLGLKILLAVSVFGHFITAMTLRRKGRLKSRHFQMIHLSVFCHMIGIVILAKTMFYAG